MAQASNQGDAHERGGHVRMAKEKPKGEVSPGETETGWISSRMSKNIE